MACVNYILKANWSAFYSSGPEIQQHLEHMVDKYTLRPYIKLRHRVVSARYLEESGKWLLTVKRPRNSTEESIERNPPKLNKPSYHGWEEFQDTADVLFTGVGALSRWDWPDIEGLDTFAGKVIHSAQWETGDDAKSWEESVADWGDKKVGVIGVVSEFSRPRHRLTISFAQGSSAIQIVPSLQPKVKHLTNFVRGKTWISSTFARESLLALSASEKTDNCMLILYSQYQFFTIIHVDKFTERDLEAFKDLKYFRTFRQTLEQDLNVSPPCWILPVRPMINFLRRLFRLRSWEAL